MGKISIFRPIRFIPTRVGYTATGGIPDTLCTVHPHSRGVYIARMIMKPSSIRFIPTRVGYTLCNFDFFCCMVRFIPTRVGYTAQLQFLDFPDTVHPHSRGVYKSCGQICKASLRFIPTRVGYTGQSGLQRRIKCGSSPLAWGIRGSAPTHKGQTRFIPTRVGYTSIVSPTSIMPRGSSPLAWGILITHLIFPNLIPFAGISVHPHSRGVYASGTRSWLQSKTVHPHSRGVYALF